jgi:hypothetical protein
MRSLLNPSFDVSEGCDQSEQCAAVRMFADPTLDMNAKAISFLIQLLFD